MHFAAHCHVLTTARKELSTLACAASVVSSLTSAVLLLVSIGYEAMIDVQSFGLDVPNLKV
jgi:hypothetical protein